MADALKLLIVEDQSDLAANIWDYFSRRGHLVDHAGDGATGLRMAMAGGYDVIVLDLGLPRLDGLLVCRRLREAGRGVPVLMLTARDTLDDKLRGFGEGADDYMVKPFALRELEARIRVLWRLARPRPSERISVPGLDFDPRTMTVERQGRSIELTRMQALILECLMRKAPAVVRKEELFRAAWGAEPADSVALHSQIHALRAAVDKPFGSPLIHTVPGVGYRIGEGA